jgi:hypothetical protein
MLQSLGRLCTTRKSRNVTQQLVPVMPKSHPDFPNVARLGSMRPARLTPTSESIQLNSIQFNSIQLNSIQFNRFNSIQLIRFTQSGTQVCAAGTTYSNQCFAACEGMTEADSTAGECVEVRFCLPEGLTVDSTLS